MEKILNNLQKASNGDYIYPAGEKLSYDEIRAAITDNKDTNRKTYKRMMNLYLSKKPDDFEFKPRELGPDYHLFSGLPAYIVDTFNGFFAGIPPVLQLPDQNENEKLQDWLNYSSFVDKLNEISKQVDIYGRSYFFVYQNEEAMTNVTVLPPTHAIMVYDDTVDRAPLAFIRYSYDTDKRLLCHVYYNDEVQTYFNDDLTDTKVNVYKQIPAICFYENDEKTSVYSNIETLLNALDDALSQKANQVSYFDNAYMVISGAEFSKDHKPDFKRNRLLLLKPTNNSNGKVDAKFLSKPDADTMQENHINRLINLIFWDAKVPNPSDESFGQNASGIALQYKYQPMNEKAATKERKFTQALRALFKVVFSSGMVLSSSDKNAWRDLKFTFTRNRPLDLDSAVKTAQDAEGLVSKQTQLSLLPFVSDPSAEIEQMQKEQRDQIKNVRAASGSLTDAEKDDSDD